MSRSANHPSPPAAGGFPAAAPLAGLAEILFRSLGVEGVYARTAVYEGIVECLGQFISGYRDPAAEVLRFPPVMSRLQLEKSGYLKSFPNLLGCVCALHGTEASIRAAADAHEAGGDWTAALTPADLVLSPAACYPVYPLVAERGALPEGGVQFDIAADCFRHEPSPHLDRLQSFRMREFVRIGSAEDIVGFRDRWMQTAETLAGELALPFTVEVANDPFFGRVGQMMAVSQRQQALKFELVVPYYEGAKPTACMSFNYHRDHFGVVWDIRDESGSTAHTSCVAFGIDRLTVALFAHHGADPARWPAAVKGALRI